MTVKDKIVRCVTTAFTIAILCSVNGVACAGTENVTEATAPAPHFLNLSLLYKLDAMGVVSGGVSRAGRVLDDLDVAADFDFEQRFGLKGLSGRLEVMMTSGGQPNAFATSLQGLDNIEVARPGTRLYQAFLEQSFGNGALSLRLGFSDLNSEFYVTDSSGLLMAPPFGIGTEMAATGSAGPSIFPSTALAVRMKYRFSDKGYLMAGLYNAEAGDLGDPQSTDWRFRSGALAVAEAGVTSHGKLAVGLWRYTHKVDRLIPGATKASSQGAYVLVEREIAAPENGVRAATGFLRAGVSDGDTGAASGGLQTGMRMSHVFTARPDSVVSVGYSFTQMSDDYQVLTAATDTDEHLFEITYSDRITPNLSIQPDFQFVRLASAGVEQDVLVMGVRFTANY